MGSKIISGIGNASLVEHDKRKKAETSVTERSKARARSGLASRCYLRFFFTKKCFCEFRSQVDEQSRTSSVRIPNQCQFEIPEAELQ